MKNLLRITLGILGLALGLPALLWELYALCFRSEHPNALIIGLPFGILISLAGYGAIRFDRILQWASFSGSVGFLILVAIMFERPDVEAMIEFSIMTSYSILVLTVGKRPTQERLGPPIKE